MTRIIHFLAAALAMVCCLMLTCASIAEKPADAADGAGNWLLVKETSYNGKGDRGLMFLYEYDANGFLVKKTEKFSSGEVSYWLVYDNDEAGRMLRETRWDESGAGIYREFKYDDDGNMILKTEYEKNGQPGMSYACEYDANGNLLKSTATRSNGKVYSITEDEYDEAGNLVHYTYSDGYGNIQSEYRYGYTLREDGLPAEQIQYTAEGDVRRTNTYDYDDRGNLILRTTYEDGELLGSVEYTYTQMNGG